MKIGIVGYGNVGRALEILLEREELELVGIFTRRNPNEVKTIYAKKIAFSSIDEFKDEIDVLCLCHGSSSDIPTLAPKLAEKFNTVDSFDNHREIEGYKLRMDAASKKGSKVSVVSVGWDPGFLSLIRLYATAFLPSGSVNTFWGRGVSRGHSEAIRKIKGVKKAIQYTVPVEDALTLASLVSHRLSDFERHRRVCYIVAEKGKEDLIASEVLNMKDYFLGYKTEIHFISESEFDKYHRSNSHRGRIYALGTSGRYREIKHSLYLDLEAGSNPDLTASIMLAAARATHKIYVDGRYGAYTVFDLPPSLFASDSDKNVNQYL